MKFEDALTYLRAGAGKMIRHIPSGAVLRIETHDLENLGIYDFLACGRFVNIGNEARLSSTSYMEVVSPRRILEDTWEIYEAKPIDDAELRRENDDAKLQ